MAREIDERVVEMRFDNKQFEEGAKETVTTLSRLREALDFSKSKKGFEELNDSVKNVNTARLVDGVTALQRRFSTFGIVSMRAIENVTDSLIGMAHRGVQVVTDSIVSGGLRRAMNLEQAHFQLQNIIGDEKKVQKVLKIANESVDGTAYSFDVAAKASSQFYASGIKNSKTMANALAGLAGTTATFSADYESMSMIWTQVAGQGRLMGDQLLQLSTRGANAAVEIAKFMNGVNSGSIKASKNVTEAVRSVTKSTKISEAELRDFVSKGKINFEIFSEAMNHAFGDSAQKANETFDGALANIKSAFARIGAGFISPLIEQNSKLVLLFNAIRLKVNDVKAALVFDEQLKNTNALSKRFTDSVLSMASASKAFIENVDLTSPLNTFYNIVDIVINSANGLLSILSPLTKAFSETFMNFSSKDVEIFSNRIKKLTENFKITDEVSKNLETGFKGIFDVIRLLGGGFLSLLNSIMPIQKPILSIGEGMTIVFANIGKNLTLFSEWVRSSEKLNSIYESFSNTILFVSTRFKTFFDLINKNRTIPKILNTISGAVVSLFRSVTSLDLSFVTESFSNFFDKLKESRSDVARAIIAIVNGFKSIGKSIASAFRENGMSGAIDIINSFFIGGIGISIMKFIEHLQVVVNRGGGVFSKVNTMLNNVVFSLEHFQAKLKADVLKSLATSIAILAGSLFVLALIDPEKMQNSLTVVTTLLVEMMASLGTLNKILSSDVGGRGFFTISYLMSGLAISIFILAAALKKVSDANPENLGASVLAITFMISEMTAASILLSRYARKVKIGVAGVIAFSAAIYILSSSIAKLGQLDVDTLQKGLVSVGVLMGELAAFMFLAKFGKLKPTQAASIILLSEALKILASSVEKFGNIDYEILKTGLSSIGIIFAELAAFSILSGYSKHVLSTATSMIIVSKALEIMEVPFSKIGSMNFGDIKRGLSGIGGLLGEISIGMRLVPKNSLIIATSLVIVSEALKKISDTMGSIGKMSWEEIGKSLLSVMTVLATTAISMNAMKGTLSGSAALLLAATSLKILSGPLITLGKLSLGEIAKGLIAIAGTFAILAISSKLLTPFVGTLLSVCGALSILTISLTAFMAALTGFNLTFAISKITSPFLALANQMNLDFLEGLVGLIPDFIMGIVNSIGNVIIALCRVITDGAPAIGEALAALVVAVCSVIEKSVPQIIDTILVVIKTVLSSLVNNAPEIITLLVRLIIKIIDAVSEHIPEFIRSVVNLFGALFSGIVGEIQKFDMSSVIQNLENIGVLAGLLIALSALSSLAGSAMIGVLAFGGLVAELSLVLAALGALSQIPGLEWLITEGGVFLEKIGIAIGQFLGGIAGGFISGATSQLTKIGNDLSLFMLSIRPFLLGASSINESTLSSIRTLAGVILAITAADLLQGISGWITGGNDILKFGEQLLLFAPCLVSFSKMVEGVTPDSVEGAANAAKVLSEMASNLPNSGGLAGLIAGENDLSKFGEQLLLFAPSLITFIDMVKDVDESSISGAVSASKVLTEFAKGVPSTGGLKSLFSGDSGLKTFGKQLVSFGGSLSFFSDKVKTLDSSSITKAIESMDGLIEMANKCKNASFDSVSNFFGSFGSEGINDFSKSLSSGSKDSVSAMTKTVMEINYEISDKAGDFKKLGSNLVESFVKGLETKLETAKKAGKKISSKAISGLKENNGLFKTSGENAAQGYINGLSAKIPDAKKVASKLASESQSALAKKNKEGSPSKIFIRSGRFAGMGYVIGMTKMAVQAYKAGQELGTKSQEGMDLGLSRMSRVFDSLDVNPVITPTVDLSGVRKSASSMNQMFNRAIQVTANAAGSITSMSRRDEASEIVSALKRIELQAASGGGNNYYVGNVDYSNNRNVGSALEMLMGEIVVQGRV